MSACILLSRCVVTARRKAVAMVVEYSSAHLEDADSELVVRSGHSTQANPHTIQEVRRILLLPRG
ncbi:MAG: hypothetical protein R3F53_16345 [Gammaproteobacteria bacterium]